MISSSPDPESVASKSTLHQILEGSYQNSGGSMVSSNSEQSFRLIDEILPFEVCLYHQVLPLSLEDRQLTLGMVNPKDLSASDYISRILSFKNYTLATRSISAELHQATLSAYLNFIGKQRRQKVTEPDKQNERQANTEGQTLARQGSLSKPPFKPSTDASNKPTFLLDNLTELLEQEGYRPHTQQPGKAPLKPDSCPIAARLSDGPKMPSMVGKVKQEQQVYPSSSDSGAASNDSNVSLLALHLETLNPSIPIQQLLHLPPPALLQELLVRVLAKGIGRLYFERQPQSGRIVWSQDGKVQAILNQVSPDQIQQLIDELKKLTNTPLNSVKSLQQLEVERVYQGERLLLRLRLMPGSHGEEATLQILRGAALRFHEQQQLASLSRDALGIAEQLQNKIDEIRNQTHRYAQGADDHLTILPALDQAIKRIEAQMATLKPLQAEQSQPLSPGYDALLNAKKNPNQMEK